MRTGKDTTKYWRQGDILFKSIGKLPNGKRIKRENGTVAYGEITGHHHSLLTDDLDKAEVLEIGDGLFVHVSEEGVHLSGATFVHQEHGPVTLPAGNFQVVIQREYAPEEVRSVID